MKRGSPGRIGAEAAAVRGLSGALRRVPAASRMAAGHRLGRLAWLLLGSRRRLAIENVSRTLDVGPERAREIAGGAFVHFGRVFAEILALPVYAQPQYEALFEVEGLEHLRTAAAAGRGTIVFSAHLGNWELVAQRQALAGHPVDLIQRPLTNPRIDALLRDWRQTCGNRVLPRSEAVRGAVRSLREGRCVALLIDQHASRPPRVMLDFLGRPAGVTSTLAWLSTRFEAPVVPVVSSPRADGGYRIVYHPPLEPPAAGPADERVFDLTRRAVRVMEDWIRQQPETWLWLHDRWKNLPAAEPSPMTGLIEGKP